MVWTNHHALLRYTTEAHARLLWCHFAPVLAMALLPLATAWMAVSALAPQPVAFYAMVFFLVNATYIGLMWALMDGQDVSPRVRRRMRVRTIVT